MPANIPAKKSVTKSRTKAGFMGYFPFAYTISRYIVIAGQNINDISLLVKGAKNVRRWNDTGRTFFLCRLTAPRQPAILCLLETSELVSSRVVTAWRGGV